MRNHCTRPHETTIDEDTREETTIKVRKAVITAAGRGARQYPASSTVQKEMFPLVDVDGLTKPTAQIIAEEALAAGIEQVCIVTAPGDAEMYQRHFRGLSDDLLPAFRGKEWALRESEQLARMNEALSYVTQSSPEGYGHAVYTAREWVGDEPFLLLLGDHVYVSSHPERKHCAQQVVEVFERVGQPVSSVKRTPERMLHLFGTVQGEPLPGERDVYCVTWRSFRPPHDPTECGVPSSLKLSHQSRYGDDGPVFSDLTVATERGPS